MAGPEWGPKLTGSSLNTHPVPGHRRVHRFSVSCWTGLGSARMLILSVWDLLVSIGFMSMRSLQLYLH